MIHGKSALKTTEVSHFTVTSAQLSEMSQAEFEGLFSSVPKSELFWNDSLTVSGVAVQSGARKTRKDAIRVIKQGGVSLNGETVTKDINITREMCLFG